LIAGIINENVGINFGGFIYDGETIVGRNRYNSMIGTYSAICDPTEGVCPLTEELAEAIKDPRTAWYVIHTYSGYENKVRDDILRRIESMKMRDKIFQVLVPTEEELEPLLAAGLVGPRSLDPSAHISRPRMAHVFFGIYFFMTGLHGFHVLIGIGIWVWMLLKAAKGQFGPTYFGPIDFTALYWHLVDLIWIYLFPLLYLIH
jgi:hypothetical protein